MNRPFGDRAVLAGCFVGILIVLALLLVLLTLVHRLLGPG